MRVIQLSESEIESALRGIPGWARQGKEIVREWERSSFMEAIAFVGRVAELAEAKDHHPDILVRYRKVELRLSTHDAGGLSQRDVDFAHALEAVELSHKRG
jgi:4a-hydroxytetrahydrobiopterin dehydratase